MSQKAIVVYNSTYGSTQKYAKWIAINLQADLLKSGDVKPQTLTKYDTIIYGGSLHAVGIKGVSLITKNIKNLSGKNIIVFSVGCSPAKEKSIQAVVEHNFPGELKNYVKHFYFRGAFDFTKLNFIDRMMMNMLHKQLSSIKRPLNEDEKGLLECYEKPIDWTDESSISPLIEYVKNEI
jgi:menaquinone-dependent protoporphyrinogen IX oxidase